MFDVGSFNPNITPECDIFYKFWKTHYWLGTYCHIILCTTCSIKSWRNINNIMLPVFYRASSHEYVWKTDEAVPYSTVLWILWYWWKHKNEYTSVWSCRNGPFFTPWNSARCCTADYTPSQYQHIHNMLLTFHCIPLSYHKASKS